METAVIFGALVIAYAISSGAEKIAGAIRRREVFIKFSGPIDITHRRDDGPST